MIRLEQLRVDALLTVEQLAAETGVSARTIRRLEDGKGAHIATLRKLASRFPEVSPSDLLTTAPLARSTT